MEKSESTKSKILWGSDAGNFPTGFAVATNAVLSRLSQSDKYEVVQHGWQHFGQPIPYNGYTIYPSCGEDYGAETTAIHLKHLKPDVLITLGDLYMVSYLHNLKRECPWIGYFPLDGIGIMPVHKHIISAMDTAVVFSKFASDILKKNDIEHRLIYLGFDSKNFQPYSKVQRTVARKVTGYENKFIIGTVCVNRRRKQIPRGFKILKKFLSMIDKSERKNVIMHLHMVPDFHEGWNLPELVKSMGLEDHVYYTSELAEGVWFQGVPVDKLNFIYNLFDVQLLPTTGEGFGLPIIEAMATGCPTIATDCSSCTELIGHGKRGELIKVSDYYSEQSGTDYALCDIDDGAEKLLKLYQNKRLRKKYATRGIAFARQFEWNNIMPEWHKLIEEVLK